MGCGRALGRLGEVWAMAVIWGGWLVGQLGHLVSPRAARVVASPSPPHCTPGGRCLAFPLLAGVISGVGKLLHPLRG